MQRRQSEPIPVTQKSMQQHQALKLALGSILTPVSLLASKRSIDQRLTHRAHTSFHRNVLLFIQTPVLPLARPALPFTVHTHPQVHTPLLGVLLVADSSLVQVLALTTLLLMVSIRRNTFIHTIRTVILPMDMDMDMCLPG